MDSRETDFPILKRITKGWLQPYLIAIDAMFSKRWDYWSRTIDAEKVLDEPIPQINWLWTPHNDPMKNLETCIQLGHNRGHSDAFHLFVDWLLYGFSSSVVKTLPPQIEPELNISWYKTFNLGLYLKYPHDYLGQYAASLYGKGKRNPTAYFPTPMHLCYFIVEMLMDKVSDKTASVCDPCVGSGRLLMAASNYSINLYGMDIDPRILKVCQVNMWMYVPWCIYRPKRIKGLDEVIKEPLPDENRLAQPIGQTTREEQTEMNQAVQLFLFDEISGE